MRSWWVLGTLLAVSSASAEELTARQILDRALERNAFGLTNAVAKMTMGITNKRGSTRERQVIIKSREVNGLGKTLVRFQSPADVAGTAFLIVENKDRDDDQFLYLPAIGKVKRIAGSQRKERFMGTDLTYADLQFHDLKTGDAKKLEDETVAAGPAYVLEAVPQPGEDTQYGRVKVWIHKEAFTAVKMEFYDSELKLLKTMMVNKLELRDGHWVALDVVIENVQTKSATHIQLGDLDFAAKLSDNEFNERALSGG